MEARTGVFGRQAILQLWMEARLTVTLFLIQTFLLY